MQKLAAAIAADIDGVDAYLVYGDWLQGKGDPRGELIALQHARSAKAKRAAAALIEQHPDAFALADVVPTWRLGFWAAARIVDNTLDVLKKLAKHPSAAYLRHLSFGRTEGRRQVFYETVIKQLVKLDFPHVRSLDFGDFPDEDWNIEWSYVGNVAPLWRAFPHLERLRLQGNRVALGTVDHAHLKSLEIRSDAPIAPIVAALAKAKLPALERLVLDNGYEELSFAPLFEATLPALRELELRYVELDDEDRTAFETSKLAKQLTRLRVGEREIDLAKVGVTKRAWVDGLRGTRRR